MSGQPGGDVTVDIPDHGDRDSLVANDLDRPVGQTLGMRGLVQAFQGAVDVDARKFLKSNLAPLRRLLLKG